MITCLKFHLNSLIFWRMELNIIIIKKQKVICLKLTLKIGLLPGINNYYPQTTQANCDKGYGYANKLDYCACAPLQYYSNTTSLSEACFQCHENCNLCTAPGTSSDCTACAPPAYYESTLSKCHMPYDLHRQKKGSYEYLCKDGIRSGNETCDNGIFYSGLGCDENC